MNSPSEAPLIGFWRTLQVGLSGPEMAANTPYGGLVWPRPVAGSKKEADQNQIQQVYFDGNLPLYQHLYLQSSSAFCTYYITPYLSHNMASRLSWPYLKTRPALYSAAAVAGAGAYYGTRTFLLPTGYAESAASPKVFGGFGFTTLRLQEVNVVNHNTKRLVFEFPDPDATSGLSLTCTFARAHIPFFFFSRYTKIHSYSGTTYILLAQGALVPRPASLYTR